MTVAWLFDVDEQCVIFDVVKLMYCNCVLWISLINLLNLLIHDLPSERANRGHLSCATLIHFVPFWSLSCHFDPQSYQSGISDFLACFTLFAFIFCQILLTHKFIMLWSVKRHFLFLSKSFDLATGASEASGGSFLLTFQFQLPQNRKSSDHELYVSNGSYHTQNHLAWCFQRQTVTCNDMRVMNCRFQTGVTTTQNHLAWHVLRQTLTFVDELHDVASIMNQSWMSNMKNLLNFKV